jgi:hypothetical protein
MGVSTIKHFAGSRDCDISQGDIYHVPWPTSPKTSPFCKNRATLIEALSGGGRHGFDEPYVGKGILLITLQGTLLTPDRLYISMVLNTRDLHDP